MPTRLQVLGVLLFLLAGSGALYVLAFTVSAAGVPGNLDSIAFVAHFDDVADLDLEARVRIAGVTVGRVADIALERGWPGAPGKAVVTLQLDRSAAQITSDARVRIVVEGLLGSRYIAIAQGQSATRLLPGGRIRHSESAVVLESMVERIVRRVEQTAPGPPE